MSKLYRSLLWSGLVVAGVAACGDDVTVAPPPPPPAPAVHSVSVTPNPANATQGGTVQLAATVNADAGLATTVTWTSASPTLASVSGTGLVTVPAATPVGTSVGITACSTVAGFTGVCGPATVNVISGPSVTSVTVTPGPSVTFVVGQPPVTFTAAVIGTGSPSQTVTWSTADGSTSVVTVGASTGVVTVVGAGSVVVKACAVAAPTVCGSSAVTVQVATPTQVSIQGITQGGTTTPVTLSNVSGQVDVLLNVDPGAGSLVKVQVLIDGVVAAEQCFIATCPVSLRAPVNPANAVQPITLSLNTRQVRKLSNGTYIPVSFNGPRNFSAKLFTSLTTSGNSSNVIPVVLQNADAWVAGTTPVLSPASTTPTFTTAGPTVWYNSDVNFVGGANYVSFFPVTPSISFGSTCGSSGNAVVGTYNTGITFAGTLPCASSGVEGPVTLSSGTGSVTPGTAPAADVIYIAADAETTEQVGSAFTVNGQQYYNLLDDDDGLDTGNSVNIDNAPPSVSLAVIAYNVNYDQKWINASFNLTSSSIVIASDGGTGVLSRTAVLVDRSLGTCTGAVIGNPHGLAETLTDSGADAYQVCGAATDNIGNTSGFTAVSNTFGVDVTPPLSRLAGSTAATPSIAPSNTSTVSATANTTIYATPAEINSQVFGLEGFDTRSGFNQFVVAGADAATQSLTRTLQSGVTGCAVNDQLTQVLSDSWIRMPVLTFIDCGSGLAGYYDYSGNVNDRAGNFSATIVRNFAFDLTAPATSFVSPAQVTYTPGSSAAFNVIASDDLEVLKSYLSFSFTGLGPPAAGIIYPYGSFPGLIIGSPWPSNPPISALVPSTGTTGTISIPYLLGRIDESCVAAGVPYPSCGAVVGSKAASGADYNWDLNLNAASSGDAAQAPTGIVTNVQDIANRDGLTGAAFSFNPVTFVTPVSEQWSGATALDTWIGKNGTGDCPSGTICADQKTQTANGLRFFTTVSLWRLNTATNQWTYCGDLAPQGPPPFVDNGVYRIWRSTMSTPTGSTACGALTGFYRVMGTLNGAGLFSPSF